MPVEGLASLSAQGAWPASEDGPFVALIDASSRFERDLINGWLDEVAGSGAGRVDRFRLPASRRRKPFANVDPAIGGRLAETDDPLCVPIRIAWLATERDGVRRVDLSDLVKLGDPRDPNVIAQRLIFARERDRCRIVVGVPARKSELQARWMAGHGRGPAEGTSLQEYVALQGWLALEQAEREIRGQRYKVPRFLREDLFWSKPFQRGVQRLAREYSLPVKRMQRRTGRYLKEIAAQHSPYAIDIVNNITSRMITAAHHRVDYNREQLHEIYTGAVDDPLVFLPSHKSNFDHLVLQHVLYENELPLNHTAGGINMNFFLVGPLLRRTGIFFIRREFKDNEPYKFTLRQYIDYLLEKRFALEWYLEGGRSRSGKLREPRLGLLAYVVDAYQRGITDDAVLIPVSIAYDQITDVSSYAAEQRGRGKESESLLWALKFIAGLRRRNGAIYVRFGDPLRVSERIATDVDLHAPEGRLTLPKLGFELATRINDVTPITLISVVTLALLSREERGFTVDEMMRVFEDFGEFIAARKLPTTFDLATLDTAAVTEAAEQLRENGVVERIDGLTERIYQIAPDQHLAAAYYRNTIIHFLVDRAITELAVGAELSEGTETTLGEVVERALQLRDLLKFEFFFAPTDEFVGIIENEVADLVGAIPDGASFPIKRDALDEAISRIILRPFLESYYVIGRVLVETDAAITQKELVTQALAMGGQLLAHGEISQAEAVSTALFTSGCQLAANRGLLDDPTERGTFLAELDELLATLHLLDDIRREASERRRSHSHTAQ